MKAAFFLAFLGWLGRIFVDKTADWEGKRRLLNAETEVMKR